MEASPALGLDTAPTGALEPSVSVCLLVISDGRYEYLGRTMASAARLLPQLDYFVHVNDEDHALGFAGAVREGWRRALETDADFVFGLEQDFIFNRPVPVHDMTHVFTHQRHLVQMALMRQPANPAERAAGGVEELDPLAYRLVQWGDLIWREHRKFVTTNPALWPRWVVERGWPEGELSEGRFGLDLFAESPSYHAGYWGEGVWVEHIGEERAGLGY